MEQNVIPLFLQLYLDVDPGYITLWIQTLRFLALIHYIFKDMSSYILFVVILVNFYTNLYPALEVLGLDAVMVDLSRSAGLPINQPLTSF